MLFKIGYLVGYYGHTHFVNVSMRLSSANKRSNNRAVPIKQLLAKNHRELTINVAVNETRLT